MKSSKLEEDRNIEENKIKGVRNLFRLKQLKKQTNDAAIKGIRNLFKLKKENKAIKDRIIKDISTLFEYEEEDCYKPVRVGNFWNNNYIEYESKCNRKKLSVKKYLNKIRPYIKDIKNLAHVKFS